MSDIEKIVAILDTDLSDELKLDLIRLLVGGLQATPVDIVDMKGQPYLVPTYPVPMPIWPTYPTYPIIVAFHD